MAVPIKGGPPPEDQPVLGLGQVLMTLGGGCLGIAFFMPHRNLDSAAVVLAAIGCAGVGVVNLANQNITTRQLIHTSLVHFLAGSGAIVYIFMAYFFF